LPLSPLPSDFKIELLLPILFLTSVKLALQVMKILLAALFSDTHDDGGGGEVPCFCAYAASGIDFATVQKLNKEDVAAEAKHRTKMGNNRRFKHL
jgi:hypothetical protein